MATKRLRDCTCFDETVVPATTTKRLHACTCRCSATTIEAPPPTLPVDLLLEIVGRSDAATIVRCAAATKSLRRAILHPSFRRRLPVRAAANGGFDPTLLLAVSYKFTRKNDPPVLVVEAPPSSAACSSLLPINKSCPLEWQHVKPVATRDVLVVLSEKPPEGVFHDLPPPQQLWIFNYLTGDTTRLPPAEVLHDQQLPFGLQYPPAFLNVGGGASRSYELLVVNKSFRTQTFSSEDGKWGAIHAMKQPHPDSTPYRASRPLVLGRSSTAAVHWLCPGRYTDDPYILALDVGAAVAARIELPPEALNRMRRTTYWKEDGIGLAATADGKLSVMIAEYLVISQWTLLSPPPSSSEEGSTAAATWSRQVVIRREVIDRQIGGRHDALAFSILFEGFGERSGAVLMRMKHIGFVAVLNLASKEFHILRCWGHRRELTASASDLCLHEIDLVSLLQAMTPL